MSSLHPGAAISLPVGSAYEYTEMWAPYPGGDRCLWRVARFERGGKAFLNGESVFHHTFLAVGDSFGELACHQHPVVEKALDPAAKWVPVAALACEAPDCSRARPLTAARSYECYPCSKRYVEACVFCQAPDTACFHKGVRERMLAYSICFTCDHWTTLLKEEARSIRIDGHHYMLGGNQPGIPGDSCSGFSGARFDILFFDDRPDITTYNLFTQGKIPEWFRDRLPDNAIFLPRNAVPEKT